MNLEFRYELEYRPRLSTAPLKQFFSDEEYRQPPTEPFEDIVRELVELSITLIQLMPDPSLGPDERIERLSRVIPTSQLQSAHRRSARNKLVALRRRLDDLVPTLAGDSRAQLQYMIDRVHELVPGEQRFIEKLEVIGDYRATDIGVSPRQWQ